ncbi:MAG: hypothetical protein IJ706_10960 [Clostridia bacterium]|nr:hypothetical protein [Clostridia bacterium]MBR1677812.1 hypothetical protein [Clostridia bacterium]
MIKNFDKVKIKDLDILGQVIDTSIRGGKKHYLVEVDEKRAIDDPRVIAPGDWAILDCVAEELELV